MSRPVPSAEQIAATAPWVSNWVSANAGSGKTHVLTQRVARLLLAGAEPQKVLCLTYTKAAASEMQVRLFRTLGDWAMADPADLAARLGELSGASGPVTDPDVLAEARRLFARALETPGGLKIQTIHAFCESLLRRFPLEAGISPRFAVADDRQSDALAAQVRAQMALAAEAGHETGFDRAARLLNEGGIDALAAMIFARRVPLRAKDLEDRLVAHFGALTGSSPEDVAAQALNRLDTARLGLLASTIEAHGGKKIQPVAQAIRRHLPDLVAPPLDVADELGGTLLRKNDGVPRKDLVTKALTQAAAHAEHDLQYLADWAQSTRADILACHLIQRTRDLYAFAQPLLGLYGAEKSAAAMLDFDDLISRASGLLNDSAMRSWVLFKLDQGVDHILVDEAQDTSPQQWQVIAAIADEFLAGAGARTTPRSIFVVGDEKQSIYSFQGAEPKAFGQMRSQFAERLDALGTPLGRPGLITSYRSAPTILDFVDAVFQGEAAEGLSTTGDPIQHRAHRKDDQGRVDLWPLVPRADQQDHPEWWEPVDATPATDAKLRLADQVAAEIARMIAQDTLPARAGEPGRRVNAGDVMVLVSRRDSLARGIIRGLKAREVPVAGADRLQLMTELVVRDLLALAKFAVMPDDDLSLAAVLRSPLCHVDEDALFRIAAGREKKPLWQVVRTAKGHEQDFAFLDDMARQADFLRPFEFLERALVHHDGRRRLLARLGPEAEDPVDEMLTQALAYERQEIPTLTGFVAWIEAGEIEVKRQMEQGEDVVRVMTVHGSKGLEAPIVILPDMMSGLSGPAGRPVLLPAAGGGNLPDLMLWAGAKEQDDSVARAAREAADQRARDERKRLLYVALTRAEDWLILCGAEPRTPPRDNWYDMVQAGMDRCPDVQKVPGPDGDMLRFETGSGAQHMPPPVSQAVTATHPTVPDWLGAAPSEPLRRRRAPSDLVAHEPAGGIGMGRDQALLLGRAVHSILEHLANHTPTERSVAAHDLMSRDFAALGPDLRSTALAQAEAVLAMPDAPRIFGPDALTEVSVAIDDTSDRPRMIGRIDRLVITPDGIEIIDIKTDARPPSTVQDVPRAYLAQLGAYHHGLATDWPAGQIRMALLWTATPRLMPIPAQICMDAFAQGAAVLDSTRHAP